MNNKKTKRVVSWHAVKGSTTLEPKFFIDDKEVTDYEYHGLGDYVDADVPTLKALLEKTEKEEPYDSAEFEYEWKPKMALIKKLIRMEKFDSISNSKRPKENSGPYLGIDEDGFPNIFF